MQSDHHVRYVSTVLATAQEEAALKAKLRRLCDRRKNGTLAVPEWLHQQWKNENHGALAKEFQQCGFDKDLCHNCSIYSNVCVCVQRLFLLTPIAVEILRYL